MSDLNPVLQSRSLSHQDTAFCRGQASLYAAADNHDTIHALSSLSGHSWKITTPLNKGMQYYLSRQFCKTE